MDISRRDFLKGSVAGAAGIAFTGLLGGCSASESKPVPSLDADLPKDKVKSTLLGDILNPQKDFTSESTDFSAIFEPLTIGKCTLKNRLVKSCAGSEMQHSVLEMSDTNLAYYERFCQGGIGMICYEPSNIIPIPGLVLPDMGSSQMDLYSDEHIAAHAVLPEMTHRYGVPVIAQMLDMMMFNGGAAPKPEDTKLENGCGTPAAQTTEQIHQEQQKFIDAAERYFKAGFDGIEINASCNHYFSTYLSRFQNIGRTDEYSGDSLENRCRIVTEIIEGIRQRVGDDFIIQILYSAIEGNLAELGDDEKCISIEEGVEMAKLFEKAGASCLHVRSQLYGVHPAGFMPDILHYNEHGDTGYASVADYGKHFDGILDGAHEGFGALIEAAARVKQAVNIPVGTVGAMDPRVAPELFNNAVRDGKIDYILMTRPLMADFHYPEKLQAGKLDEIAPCVRCMTCFSAIVDMGTPMYCRVNPALTRAYTEDMPEGYDPLPAETKKRVMVIGGGPAGMEAARIAAERGHTVTLYEKETELGGLMNLTAVIKGPHERITDHKKYLIRQLELQGVNVITGKEVDFDFIKKEAPDAVIAAVGGQPEAELINSEKTVRLCDFFEYGTNGKDLPLGETVVVYGAQIHGGDLAKYLVKQGKKVYLLNPDSADQILMGAPGWPKRFGQEWLKGKGVKIYNHMLIEKIEDSAVTIKTDYGTTVTIAFDSFVDARPLKPNRAIFDAVKDSVSEVYAIGDCYSPGTIANAVARANIIARKIGSGSSQSAQVLDENQYSATAVGIGDVTVTITVEGGKIAGAHVDTSNETAGIGRQLGEQFAQQILVKGDIDTVSSATVTSDAVREALAECKKQAGLN